MSNGDNWEHPKWNDLPIIPTGHGAKRMDDLNLNIYDVAAILTGGYDCEKGRRKQNIRERCERWRREILRIVVSREYTEWVKGPAWLVLTVKPEGI